VPALRLGHVADMRFTRLGSSGLTVSVVGLGCNNFGRRLDLEGTRAVVRAALDAGITLFDTADTYGDSEDFLGEALGGERDNVVVATKFGNDMSGRLGPDWGARGSRRYVRKAIESSLRRLRTDWIDLYQMHVPDQKTPIEETLAALQERVDEGKVRYIGSSNFAGWQVAEAEFTAQLHRHPKFISAQNEYNLLVRDAEKEVLPAVNAFGLGFLPWFPLYNGLFTGKFTRDGGPAQSRIMRTRSHLQKNAPWDTIEAYEKFCAQRGITMLEATFAWLFARPGLTSVIAGATTPEQVAQNAHSATSWKASTADIAEISALFSSPR